MCDKATRRQRHLSLVSAAMLINRNTRLYRTLVDRHFTDCHNVLMDMVAPKTWKRKLHTPVDVEPSNDLSGEGNSSDCKESTDESDNVSVEFGDGCSIQSEENFTESEENTTYSEEHSTPNEERSFQSKESFEGFEGESPQSEEIYRKTEESPVRRKESSAQSERSSEQYEDIAFRKKPSDENLVASREHTNKGTEIRTQSAEKYFEIEESSAGFEENFKERKITSEGNEESTTTRDRSSAQSEIITLKYEEIGARSTRTSASRQNSSEYVRNADSSRSSSRKRSSEISNRNEKRSRSAISHVSAETKENEEEQEGWEPSMIIQRDVATQTNKSYLQRKCQERFDENKPFGITVIYNNYRDRLPSKIICSSLSPEVKNL